MSTNRAKIPKLDELNRPRADLDINAALDHIDDQMAIDMQGPLANRPTPGIRGRYYTAVDENDTLYRDNGSAWIRVNPRGEKSILGSMISDGAITNPKIADGAVTENKIADSSIASNHLQDGSVTGGKIANLTITTNKIAMNSVTTNKIADGAVTNIKIADSAITASKLAPNIIHAGTLTSSQNAIMTTNRQSIWGLVFTATPGRWYLRLDGTGYEESNTPSTILSTYLTWQGNGVYGCYNTIPATQRRNFSISGVFTVGSSGTIGAQGQTSSGMITILAGATLTYMKLV